MSVGNAQYNTPMFSCVRENFTGTQKFQESIYLKSAESPVWQIIVNFVNYLMSPS